MSSAHPLTDHDQIRRWAESRNATPSCVKGTGGPLLLGEGALTAGPQRRGRSGGPARGV